MRFRSVRSTHTLAGGRPKEYNLYGDHMSPESRPFWSQILCPVQSRRRIYMNTPQTLVAGEPRWQCLETRCSQSRSTLGGRALFERGGCPGGVLPSAPREPLETAHAEATFGWWIFPMSTLLPQGLSCRRDVLESASDRQDPGPFVRTASKVDRNEDSLRKMAALQ